MKHNLISHQTLINSTSMSSTSFYHSLHPILFSFFLIVTITALAAQETICPFQSIYQLGDSLADTGNFIRVGRSQPAAHLPYGRTFPGRPTGRWSDGLLIIDFIASALHLPLLNPYLERTASFEYGANFAVAEATALDQSFFAARGVQVSPLTSPLSVQLNWFETFLNTTCQTPIECSRSLRRALVFVGEIGGNDIRYSQVQGKSIQEIQTYIPPVVAAIINAVRGVQFMHKGKTAYRKKNGHEVIRLGAVRIVVPGNFAGGCLPSTLTTLPNDDPNAYDEFGCLIYVNDLIQLLNNNIQQALDMLRNEYPDVVIIYADYHSAFLSVLNRAPFLGFDQTSLLKSCCGIGGSYNYDPNRECGSVGVPVCPYPAKYIHWDGIHLTQEAYRRISDIIIGDILSEVQCIW